MICVDLVGPLPVTYSGNRYILTMVDKFTHYIRAIPLDKVTAVNVARNIINHWIYEYGVPIAILADNGTQFRSRVLQIVATVLKLKQKFSSPYHPEGNGTIERFHRFLKDKLAIRKTCKKSEWENWDMLLPSIVHSYNATPHTVTKQSPFRLLYGYEPRLPIDVSYLKRLTPSGRMDYDEYLRLFTEQLTIIRNKAYELSKMTASKEEKSANEGRKEFPFQEGEFVMKKCLGLKGNDAKFSIHWRGPFEITQRFQNGLDFALKGVQDTDEKVPIIHGKFLRYPIKKDQVAFMCCTKDATKKQWKKRVAENPVFKKFENSEKTETSESQL